VLTIKLDPSLVDMAGGEDHVFMAKTRDIKFGRSLESQVRFSPSDTRLGRNHFSLRQAAGSYELVTDREHPVFIDGQRMMGTTPLLPTTRIRLVDATTGPTIDVVFTQDADGTLTDENFKGDSGTVQQGMAGTKKIAAAALFIAIIGGGYFAYQNHIVALQAFSAESQTLLQKMNMQPRQADWATIFEKSKASIYRVAIRSNDGSEAQTQGTAWVNGAHTLITNAHVAGLFDEATKNNQTLVVIAPDGLEVPIKIISAKLHPAYLPFRDTIDAVTKKSGGVLKTQGSYDLAMLTVANDAVLAQPLQIADEVSLAKLRTGDAMAYIGYPAKFASDKNIEQLRIGYIAGSSDFLGIAHNSNAELIYHTAPAVGGASGSPIFNAQGQVIAVHSGGETRAIGDNFVNSGADTFYAQSASLIADIEKPWPPEKMAMQQGQWNEATTYLTKRNQIWAMLETYKDEASLQSLDMPPEFEDKSVLAMGDQKGTAANATSVWQNAEAGTYVAFAVANSGKTEKLALRVKAGNQTLQSPLYLDATPAAIFKVETAETVIFSISGAGAQKYWLQVLKLSDVNSTP
jgi:S1-C subfamily serine protease